MSCGRCSGQAPPLKMHTCKFMCYLCKTHFQPICCFGVHIFRHIYHIKCRTHVCGTCLAMNVTWILRLPDIHNTHHKVKEFLKLHDGMHCIEHVFLCMVSYYVFCMFLYVFCTVRLLYICWAWPMWGKSSVCVFTHIACPATHSHHKQCTFHFTTSLLQVRSEALS